MEHVTETVEQMYHLYHQDIVHFFAEHLSDRDICWDLCHEVFLRLLLAQAAGMSLKKPRRWLMRVATNLLVDTYRQRAVSRAQVVPLSEDLSVKLVDAKAFWSLIEREDLLERITRTFRALPRKARLLLYWREFERLSGEEMAMQLKTTEAVVSTELWRARTQFQQTYLREHFQGLLHPDEEIFEHLVRLVPFDLVTPPDEQLQALEKRTRAYFDRSASSWDAYVSRAYEAGLTAQLQHVLPWQKEMKVLDVGTGTGYLALTVAPMVGEVIGVDSVPSMLRRAGEKSALGGYQHLSFRTGVAEQLPIETGSVDVVMCHMLLHHVLSPKQVLREMRRVVRPGGYLMIVDGYHHRHVWTLTEVSDFLCGIDHRRLQRDLADNGVRTLHLSDAGLTHLGETVGRKTTFPNFLLLGRVIGESACGTTEKVSPKEMHSSATACFLHEELSTQVHSVPLF